MSSEDIKVHHLTNTPTMAWDTMKKRQPFTRLSTAAPTHPIKENMLRFVCMSDTHNMTSLMKLQVPDGDVFLHAGDFTMYGDGEEVETFNAWLGTLPHKHKYVIAGNHDLCFDAKYNIHLRQCRSVEHAGIDLLDGSQDEDDHQTTYCKDPTALLTAATYLQDSLATVAGVTVYGAPWQPRHLAGAFNLDRGRALLQKWDLVPAGVAVLLTHGPPLGHGDLCSGGGRVGCVELLATVQQRVRPQYHVFGHVHEGYGITTDGHTTFLNAATCNTVYTPCNPALVFDVPVPAGHIK